MTHHFRSVRALLRAPDRQTREIVSAALADQGCRCVVTADHRGEAEHYLRADMVDLLICDAGRDPDEACDAVRRMRNSPGGDNAFALSVILTERPNPGQTMRLIDSGTDAILVKPFPPAALAERLRDLVRGARQFVVTDDYIGPARCGDDAGQGADAAPRVEVPNPLRETVLATMSRDELRRAVRTTWEVVAEHRIESQTAHLVRLVARIRTVFASRPPAAEAAVLLAEVLGCASELRLRVAGTGFDHVAHLATTLIEICYGLGHGIDDPDARWLAALPKVAAGIAIAFSREREGIQASRRISRTIHRKVGSHFPDLIAAHP